MSLEQELVKNTAALVALTEALTKAFSANVPNLLTPKEELRVEVYQGATKVLKVAAPAVQPLPDKENYPTISSAATYWAAHDGTPLPTTVAPPVAATPAYADVVTAITTVYRTDKAKLVAALAKFKATKGTQLAPADYAAFLAELAT